MSAMSIETFQMESCKMSKPSLIAEPISPSSSELKSPPLCHEYNDYFVNNIASIVEQLYDQYVENSRNLDWNHGQQSNFSSAQDGQLYTSDEARRQYEIRFPYDTMQLPENNLSLETDNNYMERPEPVISLKMNNRGVGRKRTRTAFTPEQLKNLEKEFGYQNYLCNQRKTALAQNLKLSEKQIKIWFQNRRMKFKKEEKNKSPPTNSNENCSSPALSVSSRNPSVNLRPKLQHIKSEQSTIVDRLQNDSALVQKQQLPPALQEFPINSYNPQWDNNMFYNNQYYMQPQIEGTCSEYISQVNNLTNHYNVNSYTQRNQETSETVYQPSINNENVSLCQNKSEAHLTDNKMMFNSHPAATISALQELLKNSYNPQWDNNIFYNNQYYMHPQLEGTYSDFMSNLQVDNLLYCQFIDTDISGNQQNGLPSISNEDVPLYPDISEEHLTDNKTIYNSNPAANVSWYGNQHLSNITPPNF